mgnify:CR=1 FL=1
MTIRRWWIGFFSLAALTLLAAPRDELWRQVKEATQKRRPRTAIEHLEAIYPRATELGAHGEAVRALAQKLNLQAQIEGNKAEEKIEGLQTALADAPAAQRPVLETILAHWYWQYFQQNRWQIMQRTQTAEPPGEDIRTWGLPRLFDEIGKHFDAALEAREQLLSTPIERYATVLNMGQETKEYRPTLYDFLAFEALTFYASGEQAGAAPEDAFVLQAASPVLASVDEFLAWEVEATDTDSPIYKGVKLYQELLRTHRDDDNPAAFFDANLHRLQFANNHAVGPEKTQRYIEALAEFAEEVGGHRISARIRHQWAAALQSEGQLVEAQKVAAAGMESHPDSVGGKLCFNLNQQIQAPAVNLSAERVWTAPWPAIQVDYKNLTELHCRIVRLQWENPPEWEQRGHPVSLNRDRTKELLARDPLKTWSVDLPPTEDFQMAREDVAAPADLAKGFYALLVSPRGDFREGDNVVKAATFWVSDLALVTPFRAVDGKGDGYVLDARTGEPVEGATVHGWFTAGRNRWRAIPKVVTGADGAFQTSVDQRGRNLVFLAESEGDRLSSDRIWVHRNQHPHHRSERSVLFTDRAIYRPGQTIRYKGICFAADQRKNDYETLANRTVEVILRDGNGKEVAKHEHTTNDYGSFTGSFTAPTDRLTGAMTLQCTNPGGSARVRVEEYKRPKFRVTVQSPDKAPKLGETVTVQGKAESYTGAAVDGATVRYRIVREVRYPPWIGWYHWGWTPQPQNGGQEIAHGTAETAVDGTFSLQFPATPDRSVDPEGEPIFQFTVTADVTDAAGETRSAQRTVSVGYAALAASVSAPPWIEADKPFELLVTTQSLDNEPVPAEGTVEIYALKTPESVHRTDLGGRPPHFALRRGHADEPPDVEPDLSDPNNWELAEVVAESAFATDASGKTTLKFELPAGHYRAKLATQDRFGNHVKALRPLQVLDPQATTCTLKIPYLLETPSSIVEPGESFRAVWGTGYETGRARVEIRHRDKVLQSYWTEPGATQAMISQDVTEEMRGGFLLHVFMVRENRFYSTNMRVAVPWSNKDLSLRWETFRSKLKPGQEETWTAVVEGPDAEPAAAEFAATLYDASLDTFVSHGWTGFGNVFYTEHPRGNLSFQNSLRSLRNTLGHWQRETKPVSFQYPEFITGVVGWRHHGPAIGFGGGEGPFAGGAVAADRMSVRRGFAMKAESAAAPTGGERGVDFGGFGRKPPPPAPPPPAPPPPDVDLSQVSARTNLQETAFFYPQLTTGEDGTVRMEFTMPEALTQWRFMGFAHDRELRAGRLDATVTTSKDLMVRPNPPRFLRMGDELEFTVKVVNQSPTRQRGSVRLTFRDARTNDPADEALGNTNQDKAFDIPAKESRSISWRIAVPDGTGFLVYKAVASTGKLADGQEDFLPVLPRKILVHEAVQMHARGAETKTFTLENLARAGQSDTLEHQSLTVQVVSNPAWYAVLALPYLMEQPHECSEQAFNRLYANALAGYMAHSDPRIRRTFEQWRGTKTLESPLEKNEELKSVILQETPWMREADNETEARRNIGVLFEGNRLKHEIDQAFQKVRDAQYGDGSWPWFPGGEGNRYVTQYIACGFARLRHLGVDDLDMAPAFKAVKYLDAEVDKQYRQILKHGNKNGNHLSPPVAFHLYTRSFFLDDVPVDDKHRDALDYFLGQATEYWTQLDSRQCQAHIALALHRFGKGGDAPKDIVISLREHSKHDEEMGMYWETPRHAWWWYHAPIETQAIMIELFDEVAKDPAAVEACKVWLLKQKQTQHWRSTKATADAVYAILSRGANLLADTTLATLQVAEAAVEPKNVEPGTGFYMKRFASPEITPEMAEVTLKKTTPGIAWGGVHWSYFEAVGKVPVHDGTPLALQKDLYVKCDSKEGPVLHRLDKAALRVGDELVVRIELRSDRDMEYLHLKDDRGSGLEPINVLSQYRHQDGLRYYESTRDTATHFYIDYLPKGTYVFEYPVRVQHRGAYQSGIAHIECMYAPEFNSHSASTKIEVAAPSALQGAGGG